MSIEFRAKVLKKHGLFVLFDGESPAADRETFASWSRRVLRKEPLEVVVFRPTCVSSGVLMSTLADEGKGLRELVKEVQARVQSEAAESERKLDAGQSKKTDADLEAAASREKRSGRVALKELRELFDESEGNDEFDEETMRFIERTITEASKSKSPVKLILRELLQRQRTLGRMIGDEAVR